MCIFLCVFLTLWFSVDLYGLRNVMYLWLCVELCGVVCGFVRNLWWCCVDLYGLIISYHIISYHNIISYHHNVIRFYN